MRRVLVLLICLFALTSANWRTDFAKAKTEAAQQSKYILLKFSGSDWCLPCIKMEKRVFDKDVFQQFANDKLILINADFPRLKKNMPSKDIIKSNEMLAETYNKTGHFPYTVLLSADGKVIKTWDGYKTATPEEFVKEVKTAISEQ